MADNSILEGMRRRLAEATSDLAEAEALPPSGQRDAIVATIKREIERRQRQVAQQEEQEEQV